MESTLPIEVSVSADGRWVAFVAHIRGRAVQCSITRTTLEQYFWVPNGANEARLLKALTDGRSRIVAIVERKMLIGPGEPMKLTDADFAH
jgi:Protein of unknown function (DUF1488)